MSTSRWLLAAYALHAAGIVLFCGALWVLALTTKSLGPAAPLGGMAFIELNKAYAFAAQNNLPLPPGLIALFVLWRYYRDGHTPHAPHTPAEKRAHWLKLFSRRLVESDMSSEAVATEIVKLYRSLLEDDPLQADNHS